MTDTGGVGGLHWLKQHCHPKCRAPQTSGCRGKASVWAVPILTVILFFDVIAAFVIPAKSQELDKGTFRIWVLAGMVGDDYWIYLNGKIVSAPPREKREPLSGGVEIWSSGIFYSDNDHLINIYHDGQFTAATRDYIKRFVDPSSGDVNHLFYPVDIQLVPGKNAIEVAYLTHGRKDGDGVRVGNTFPFVITEKLLVDMDNPPERNTMFVAVPNDWSAHVQYIWAADSVCGIDGGGPRPDTLTEIISGYLNDPVVHALRALDISLPSLPDNVVILNLPATEGGVREFDRNQIKYMASEILENYQRYASHETVADCKEKNDPAFSESYDEYDKLISDFDSQLQFFHTLNGE